MQIVILPMDYSHVMPCLEIEHESFPHPWPYEAFCDAVRDMRQRGSVLILNRKLVGYCIVEISSTSHQIVNLAVHPEYRRRGIARRLVTQRLGLLGSKPFMSMFATVGERNLAAQLFFKSMGFLYVNTIKEFFNTPDDAYVLQYRNGDCRERIEASSEGDYRGEALR
jgi:[ribosomal protein S18]-alanine N-acetyltransferase